MAIDRARPPSVRHHAHHAAMLRRFLRAHIGQNLRAQASMLARRTRRHSATRHLGAMRQRRSDRNGGVARELNEGNRGRRYHRRPLCVCAHGSAGTEGKRKMEDIRSFVLHSLPGDEETDFEGENRQKEKSSICKRRKPRGELDISPKVRPQRRSRARCSGASSSGNGRPTKVTDSAPAGNVALSSLTGLRARHNVRKVGSQRVKSTMGRTPCSSQRGSPHEGCTRGHMRR